MYNSLGNLYDFKITCSPKKNQEFYLICYYSKKKKKIYLNSKLI